MMKKFAVVCGLLLVLAMSVDAEARCRRCRGGKCCASACAAAVEGNGAESAGEKAIVE